MYKPDEWIGTSAHLMLALATCIIELNNLNNTTYDFKLARRLFHS